MQEVELPYSIKRKLNQRGLVTHKNRSLAGQEVLITFTKPKKVETK